MSKKPKDAHDESEFDKELHKLTDLELAKRIFDFKAQVDAHMLELARRLQKPAQPEK